MSRPARSSADPRRRPPALRSGAPLALALPVLALLAACSPTLPGTVIAVHDGDTVSVRGETGTVRVRIACIDAPERGQPFSARARQELAGLVLDRAVRLEAVDHDRYGRLVARVFLDSDGADVGAAMVARGMAWHYRHHCPDDGVLAAAEDEARRARHGLWRERGAIPPWEWRRR